MATEDERALEQAGRNLWKKDLELYHSRWERTDGSKNGSGMHLPQSGSSAAAVGTYLRVKTAQLGTCTSIAQWSVSLVSVARRPWIEAGLTVASRSMSFSFSRPG